MATGKQSDGTIENRYASPSFLANPPRQVPLLVRLRLMFGGFLNQFGWFFLGFGMIFVWAFVIQADPLELVDFRGDLEQVNGKVMRVEETGYSSGSNERGSPILGVYYNFEWQGDRFESVSYTKSRKSRAGDEVGIEFPTGRPERSRIQGMSTAVVPIFVLFVLVFPTLGLVFVSIGFRGGLEAIQLLKQGKYTTGQLMSKEATNTEINNRKVFELTFGFTTESGAKFEASAKTHEPELLEDDEHEPLVYDPMQPNRNSLLDHLPGSPKISHDGQILVGSSATTFACLLVPFASIVGHGIAGWSLFG